MANENVPVVDVDVDERYQRAVAYHLLTYMHRLKEIELAMSRHMLGAMDLSVPPDQVIVGLDKIAEALCTLGDDCRAENLASGPLVTLLYARAHKDTWPTLWGADQWVKEVMRRADARRRREREARNTDGLT